MSAALAEAIEALHITAARKLLELLETEKDAGVLSKLIATASRFKLPRPANPRAAAVSLKAPAPSTPEPASHSATADQSTSADDPAPAPPLQPYTEEEYRGLVKRHGVMAACDMRLDREHAVWLQRRDARTSTSPP